MNYAEISEPLREPGPGGEVKEVQKNVFIIFARKSVLRGILCISSTVGMRCRWRGTLEQNPENSSIARMHAVSATQIPSRATRLSSGAAFSHRRPFCCSAHHRADSPQRTRACRRKLKCLVGSRPSRTSCVRYHESVEVGRRQAHSSRRRLGANAGHWNCPSSPTGGQRKSSLYNFGRWFK
jgi:hypothetical protein